MGFPQVSQTTARSEFRGLGARGVTAAAVLLAAGTLNLAAEGTAEAGSGGTWDRLAGCESGGNWHIDTGNGFSGGLQFTDSTWRSFGGGAYASQASHATREQQIQVAQRVLARQGWGAWPACSNSLGFNSATGAGTPRRTATAPDRDRVRRPLPQKHYKAQPRPARGGTVVVNSGDTVSGIAYAHGLGWREFYRLNRQVIGANPHLIHPGMRLAVRHSGTG